MQLVALRWTLYATRGKYREKETEKADAACGRNVLHGWGARFIPRDQASAEKIGDWKRPVTNRPEGAPSGGQPQTHFFFDAPTRNCRSTSNGNVSATAQMACEVPPTSISARHFPTSDPSTPAMHHPIKSRMHNFPDEYGRMSRGEIPI